MTLTNDHGLLLAGDTPLGYILHFPGHGAWTPDGNVDVTEDQADAHNKLLDKAMIDGLKRCKVGQCGTFYFYPDKGVQTWMGTVVAPLQSVQVNGVSLTFTVMGMTFRGRLQKHADCFNFRRIS